MSIESVLFLFDRGWWWLLAITTADDCDIFVVLIRFRSVLLVAGDCVVRRGVSRIVACEAEFPVAQHARPWNSLLALDPIMSRYCGQRSCRLHQKRPYVFDCDYGAQVEPPWVEGLLSDHHVGLCYMIFFFRTLQIGRRVQFFMTIGLHSLCLTCRLVNGQKLLHPFGSRFCCPRLRSSSDVGRKLDESFFGERISFVVLNSCMYSSDVASGLFDLVHELLMTCCRQPESKFEYLFPCVAASRLVRSHLNTTHVLGGLSRQHCAPLRSQSGGMDRPPPG
jgi:hypothetical protein